MPAPELSPRQVEQLRTLLLAKQLELQTQMSGAEAATKPVVLDQQSVGRVSRIDAIQQQQMAIANQQQAAQLIKSIESALQRVDSGEYGYCLQCQEPVAFARLQAQPFANLCLDCQSTRKKA